ncbi:MAG: hypothetical protein KC646_08590 [Candidatus Cloacimonetes bacterium]|nr:hypothetical protein [Candidatus Cloacimonadota bacterium]
MDEKKNKDDFDDKFFNKLLVVITASSFIGFTFISFYSRQKEQSPERLGRKECFLIQQNLAKQANKYDEDLSKKLIVTSKKSWTDLVDHKYITSVPKDPECQKSDHYRRDQMGNVFCLHHGSYEGLKNEVSEVIVGKAECKN